MDPAMKTTHTSFLTFLVLSVFCHGLSGDEPDFGAPFEPANTGCEILWSEKVGNFPEKAPHYAAGGHKFPEKVVQYFKKIGGFTDKSRVTPSENLPSRKDSEVYKTETRDLNLSPMTGCMVFRSRPNAEISDLAEAPTPEAGKEMARKLLLELGFDLSLLSFERVRYTSGTRTRYDRSLGKTVTRRDHTGVFIPRLYEGVASSRSGIQVNYGLSGELLEFSVCWRDVKAAGQRRIPSREEIAKTIQEGGSTIRTDRAQNANRLTIDRAVIHYIESEPFRVATSVEPILRLSGKAEVNGAQEDFSMYLRLP